MKLIPETDKTKKQRLDMVKYQLINRGIKDEKVLDAFRLLPRHSFVLESLVSSAYDDKPLPIGNEQTISQPYIVAYMTEMLELSGNEKVLEIGTGSGYQCAILSMLTAHVVSIERIEELYIKTKSLLLGYFEADNITLVHGDGAKGYTAFAPYDAIVATAAAKKTPKALFDQLKDGGKLVIPEGNRMYQTLYLYVKQGDTLKRKSKGGCVFVPFVGA